MQRITENVYVETKMHACNLGLITTKEGVVLVDTPLRPTDAVKWRNEASRKGEIRYLINTEEHEDHWQTTWFFPGVLIAHQANRDFLTQLPANEVLERVKFMDPDGLPLMKGYQIRLADIAFNGNLDLYLGSHTIRLLSLPGHVPGGVGVYIPEERVVFTGDIVFYRRKSWLHDADPSHWLESIRRIGELDIDVIVPGHGDLCNKDYLKEQTGIIQQWIEAVQLAIHEGLSEEEAAIKISCHDPHPKQPNSPMTDVELNRAIIARLYHLYSN